MPLHVLQDTRDSIIKLRPFLYRSHRSGATKDAGGVSLTRKRGFVSGSTAEQQQHEDAQTTAWKPSGCVKTALCTSRVQRRER